MGIIIRVAFNNQNWMGACKKEPGSCEVLRDQRFSKCFGKAVDTGPTIDENGNCTGGGCWEKTLCTKYYWVSSGNFKRASIGDKVFFVFPDIDNSLVLWGRSEVRSIEPPSVEHPEEYRLYFKDFKPMPEGKWIKGLRAKKILGVNWGSGTFRYLNEAQEDYIEELMRRSTWMDTVTVELKPRVKQLVEGRSRAEQISPEQAVQELIELGFEIRLKELYERYRRADCSFGYLAQAMGMTTWELTHLLEERGWPTYNLPG